MEIKLKIWRQNGPKQEGYFEDHKVEANPDMSFLEMLDVLNEGLLTAGKDPVSFDHDCREGICGACSMVIDGQPHGPRRGTTACQLHMREYSDGAEITIEPWRAKAFPIIKDLVVDRGAFDRIQRAGGYVSVSTGSAVDANTLPIGKDIADEAFDYAACIGCGACVAACPNASAMLFVGAKVAHLALLPQGAVERRARVRNMIQQMDTEGFGGCTNHGECSAYCPKKISFDAIEILNREYWRAGISRS
ncbi:MAG TPA: succinate dehydrogenase/fumarate reductase iron-sulfur subunit [Enhygromyxa sp.]|nr:succinate dehydrogenase/fumarate reductase iron-sulfur subunit [Enhygromyxa sp.]